MDEKSAEKWAPIHDHEGIYEVSNMGRVRRLTPEHNTYVGRILRGSPCLHGYRIVCLCRYGVRSYRKVHVLVARAFCERPKGKNFVNHKNGIKADCRSTNLEWCTSAENIQHAIRTGLMKPVRGEQNGNALLTRQQVEEVRRRYAAGGVTQTALGEEFGVNHRTIHAIVRRVNWA